MITDPSWLYSTIAQSSAAIVAIIGGFITATVLMLMAEKRSLTNQLADRKVRLENPPSKDIHVIGKLKAEVDDLTLRIEKFSYPPNLGWGVLVLGYLATFGIVLPVFIIAYEVFFVWAKILTLVTFCLGIIGIFTYIVFQIRTLRRTT